MPLKEIDREKRKFYIAKRALDLFSEFGFHETSMSQIALRTNLGKGTLYEYFESKDELISYSLLTWSNIIHDQLQEIHYGLKDPVHRLNAYVNKIVDILLKDEKLVKLSLSMFQLMLSNYGPALNNNPSRELLYSMRKFIIDALYDGVDEGIFRKDVKKNSLQLAIYFISQVDGLILHYYLSKQDFNIKMHAKNFVKKFVEDLK